MPCKKLLMTVIRTAVSWLLIILVPLVYPRRQHTSLIRFQNLRLQ